MKRGDFHNLLVYDHRLLRAHELLVVLDPRLEAVPRNVDLVESARQVEDESPRLELDQREEVLGTECRGREVEVHH